MIKKFFLILTFILLCFISACDDPTQGGSDVNPPVDNTQKVFYRIDAMSQTIQNQKVELALFEKEPKIAEEGNPYDYNYMKVILELTSPSGKVQSIPAFWYQDYNIVLNTMSTLSPSGISGTASTSKDEPQGLEQVSAVGDPHYRVRFTPLESGTYKYVVKVYKYGTLCSTENERTIDITPTTEKVKGVIKVDETNNRSFIFEESKESFVGIGQNTGWYTSSTRKTEDYRVWFEKMNQNNMNLSRVWMATWGFSLHWGKKYNDYSDRYSQAARLDKLIELAEEYDVYFLLTLINHGQFSSNVNAEWDNNPYNTKNGGICKNASDFFTSDEAKEAYKNELLYIIARYGYSNKILSWELVNETDWIDNYSLISAKFKTWHSEMSTFIKANDPFSHMVSTSYRGNDGNANALDTIDFTSPHDYGYTNKNMINGIKNTQATLTNKYNKPVLFGEIGLGTENGYQVYQQDPNGVTLHQQSWAGMMAGGAGGAMNWWWDSYVHPYDLYSNFKGAGLYASKLNLSGSDYKLIQNSTATISSSSLGLLGYTFKNRVYGYVYDTAWTYYNQNMASKNNITVTVPIDNGSYTLTIYDTLTGEVIKTISVNVENQKTTFTLPSFKTDIAFILN